MESFIVKSQDVSTIQCLNMKIHEDVKLYMKIQCIAFNDY